MQEFTGLLRNFGQKKARQVTGFIAIVVFSLVA
ncbi:hypothetical protein Dbac_2094 [Desulfomicrobium baculatum DSM 4028]|uniref:Uncharacterized protein n=1 Tax=Desulfomicrobium baculatum (strain DSM 4028 / VKM B-1378 / X) TaxID=525897 RepID=C7LNV5_DESBD|nr:hypothetical protein Dbac_2094 [Desulfomicrobium baculatum DSM 4028]